MGSIISAMTPHLVVQDENTSKDKICLSFTCPVAFLSATGQSEQ